MLVPTTLPASVLPNLDVDEPGAIGPDAADDRVNGPGDEPDLLRFPVPASSGSATLFLEVRPEDARWIRVFVPDGAGGKVRLLGAAEDPAEETYRAQLPRSEAGKVELAVEAVTLKGAPGFPGSPDGEIRLTVTEEDGREVDTLTFTVAPFQLISNLQPAEQIYVTYFAGERDDSNHPTVFELVQAVKDIHPDSPVPGGDTSAGFAPGRAGLLTILDGAELPDHFPQDEFEIGFCRARDATTGMILHHPRGRGLGDWVRHRLPEPGLGLFDDLAATAQLDSTDFGGNLEVTPPGRNGLPGRIIIGESHDPVFTLPPQLAADLDAGGSSRVLRAFARASFPLARDQRVTTLRPGSEWRIEDLPPPPPGRPAAWRVFEIVAGDDSLTVFFVRGLRPDFRRFLQAQGAQPVLAVDTSWLAVGHVDELLSVVPGTADAGYRVLVASPGLAVSLLEAAKELNPTDLFRGLRRRGAPARTSVPELLDEGSGVATTNRDLQLTKLTVLEQELLGGLDLRDDQIIRIPVLFERLDAASPLRLGKVHMGAAQRVTALMPNLVNAVVLGRHVLIPRPKGPRVSSPDVRAVLDAVGAPTLESSSLRRLGEHWHWERFPVSPEDLARTFGVEAKEVEENNPGLFAEGWSPHTWTRIRIPGDSVDVFEALVTSRLEQHGLHPHFVDTWFPYLDAQGALHCATNVRRTPPTPQEGAGS